MQPKTPAPRRNALLLPNERVVTVIYKHLIGIILLVLGFILTASVLVGFVVMARGLFAEQRNYNNFTAAAIFALLLLFIIFGVAIYVYRQSRIMVTNLSLIQVLQKGLFFRKVSRLSLADVEDVTADQAGILPSMFNYGTLIIETAGELENFVFGYCPDPNKHAQEILEARQRFTEGDTE
jgi:membrane protein YdbS with pleckstrin-like domain